MGLARGSAAAGAPQRGKLDRLQLAHGRSPLSSIIEDSFFTIAEMWGGRRARVSASDTAPPDERPAEGSGARRRLVHCAAGASPRSDGGDGDGGGRSLHVQAWWCESLRFLHLQAASMPRAEVMGVGAEAKVKTGSAGVPATATGAELVLYTPRSASARAVIFEYCLVDYAAWLRAVRDRRPHRSEAEAAPTADGDDPLTVRSEAPPPWSTVADPLDWCASQPEAATAAVADEEDQELEEPETPVILDLSSAPPPDSVVF